MIIKKRKGFTLSQLKNMFDDPLDLAATYFPSLGFAMLPNTANLAIRFLQNSNDPPITELRAF